MPENRNSNGRNIAGTEDIPIENVVISEIPIKRAESIGHLVIRDEADGK